MENSMEVPQKTMELPYGPANPLLDIHPSKAIIQDTCSPVFTAALFTAARHGNSLNVHWELNQKDWCTQSAGHYPVTKSETPPFAATGVDPGAIQWSKWGQSERERQIPHAIVRGVCNLLGSISLQQKCEAMDGPVLHLCVTAQFYLESKGKYILEAWGHANPKDTKRREATSPILAPLFICFFLPWACPM